MSLTVFFSWQADTPNREGRSFIERALERAVSRIAADVAIEEAVRGELEVDRDTKGAPGSPPIVDTIFRKIDQAAIFVPDLTFVGKRADGRPTPNPNVLIEYGWALKSMTHARIVPVMNAAFGYPTREAMPFDMAHLRFPITYECAVEVTDAQRKEARDGLASTLESAIRAVLVSAEFQESLPKPAPPAGFIARASEDGPGRFRPRREPLGVLLDPFRGAGAEIALADKPVIWFRMMPSSALGREWTPAELQKASTQNGFLTPVSNNWRGYEFMRSHEGFGIYSFLDDQCIAEAVVFAFVTGEIWSIDAWWLDAMKREAPPAIPNVEKEFRRAMNAYCEFLLKLGIPPPFKWIAGLEDLKGRGIFVPAPPGHIPTFPGPHGKCQL